MQPSADSSFSESLHQKRILVLGAGYLGGELVRRALAQGAKVAALTRNEKTAAELAGMGALCVAADLSEPVWHDKVGPEWDWVLVSVGSGSGGLPGYHNSYVRGLSSVADWAVQAKPERLVYTSSTSVYLQNAGECVGENDPAATPAEDSRSGLLASAEALVLSMEYVARRSVLRLAGLYGPGRHLFLDQLRDGIGSLSGRGERHLNLIHRSDAVSAVFHAWSRQASESEIFNVADDGRATRAQIAEWLAFRLGRTPPTFNGQEGTRLVGDRIIANEKIKRLLGWRPLYASFREGYGELLAGV